MTEHSEFNDPATDAALDRELLALKRFTPRPGFDNRVMARVIRRTPVPAPAARAVRIPARKAPATPRRLWWTAGLAAAGSTVWTAAAASWATSGGWAASSAWLAVNVADPLRVATLQAAGAAGQNLAQFGATAFDNLGAGVFAIAAAAAITPVLSAWGLFLTMKQHSSKRMAYAVR